ncbi:MAG: hypothetical protein B7C54_06085 [Acidimicrobiales bacterium mtb01]|nr:hypothetical protein [Actinomycetota bacterium]TEX46758.1 MAG: hypothetical protein B7C54_06085 [Acidimicrobiales bacterium mtb01]
MTRSSALRRPACRLALVIALFAAALTTSLASVAVDQASAAATSPATVIVTDGGGFLTFSTQITGVVGDTFTVTNNSGVSIVPTLSGVGRLKVGPQGTQCDTNQGTCLVHDVPGGDVEFTIDVMGSVSFQETGCTPVLQGGEGPCATGSLDILLPQQQTYTVSYGANSGSGAVPVDQNSYDSGDPVTVLDNSGSLVNSGYTFSGWCTTQPAVGSACGGTPRQAGQTFAIIADTTLFAVWLPIAVFVPAMGSVSYDANGGVGSITSTIASISAPVNLATGSGISRTGYTLTGWNSSKDGQGNLYALGETLKMPVGGLTLYAVWGQPTLTLVENTDGLTFQAVDSTYPLWCGEPIPAWGILKKCSSNVNAGSNVTIGAIPSGKKYLAAWGGACAGTSTTSACTLTVTESVTVSATFADNRLSVTKTGSGTGVVQSFVKIGETLFPGSLVCGATCSEDHFPGSTVVLGAVAGARSTFKAWGGACAGTPMTSTCSVTINQAKNVTAEFEKDGLEVTINAPRYGLVASLSPLILCGRFFGVYSTICSVAVKPGQKMELFAAFDPVNFTVTWNQTCGTVSTAGFVSTCEITVPDNGQAPVTVKYECKSPYRSDFEIGGRRIGVGADLSRVSSPGTSIQRACLIGADLSYANLTGADLSYANLTGVDLSFAILTNANLTGANLTGAKLSYANLTGADLTGADLTGAVLTYANLTNANLTNANLNGANLSYANLSYAIGYRR